MTNPRNCSKRWLARRAAWTARMAASARKRSRRSWYQASGLFGDDVGDGGSAVGVSITLESYRTGVSPAFGRILLARNRGTSGVPDRARSIADLPEAATRRATAHRAR